MGTWTVALQGGQLITAPFLPAPAGVKKFEPRAGCYHLEVVLRDGHHTYKPLRITEDQLARVRPVERDRVAPVGNTGDFSFSIDAGAGKMILARLCHRLHHPRGDVAGGDTE